MKKLILILIIILIVASIAISTKISSNCKLTKNTTISYQNPIKAKKKNTDNPFAIDSLFATIDSINFVITPKGKLIWKNKTLNKINLSTKLSIDVAYLYKKDNILFVFYTETDFEGSTSRVEKFDLNTKKQIWQNEIYAFNLGLPYIVENFAYVTTIGTVGKLNLETGKYIYQYKDLYDREKTSFNSFSEIIFKDSLTIFLSKNRKEESIDSIIINENTQKIIIKK